MALIAAVVTLTNAFSVPAQAAPDYDAVVTADSPVVYYSRATNRTWIDAGPGRRDATFPRGVTLTGFGGNQPVFDGLGQYAVRGDDDVFSPASTGSLTVEAWIRPDTLEFPRIERTGYVMWAGKGERSGPQGNREWGMRMYSAGNTDQRANRLSGYVFGPQGGLGAGSYHQAPVEAMNWIHVVFVVNTAASRRYPMGYTRIYVNGEVRQSASISAYPAAVSTNKDAKLRIATVDGASYFKGAIAKFAVYDRELPGKRVAVHYRAAPMPDMPTS